MWSVRRRLVAQWHCPQIRRLTHSPNQGIKAPVMGRNKRQEGPQTGGSQEFANQKWLIKSGSLGRRIHNRLVTAAVYRHRQARDQEITGFCRSRFYPTRRHSHCSSSEKQPTLDLSTVFVTSTSVSFSAQATPRKLKISGSSSCMPAWELAICHQIAHVRQKVLDACGFCCARTAATFFESDACNCSGVLYVFESITPQTSLSISANPQHKGMPQLGPADVVVDTSDSGSDSESSDPALPPHHSSTSPPKPTAVESVESPALSQTRRERLRARQALQSDVQEKADQHKPAKHHRRQKPSAAVLGCLAAAALATACIGWWFKRRKLKRKAQDARQLFLKCRLMPSEAVLTAVPAPPLLSTTFVTTAG